MSADKSACAWTGCWADMPHEHDSKGTLVNPSDERKRSDPRYSRTTPRRAQGPDVTLTEFLLARIAEDREEEARTGSATDLFFRSVAAVYDDHPDYRDEWRP